MTNGNNGQVGERGAVLLFALVFIGAIALVIGALVSQSFAQFNASRAFASRQQGIYAADAGIERAIANITAAPFGAACDTGLSYNGYNVDVECDPVGSTLTVTSVARRTDGRTFQAHAIIEQLADGTIDVIEWDTRPDASFSE